VDESLLSHLLRLTVDEVNRLLRLTVDEVDRLSFVGYLLKK